MSVRSVEDVRRRRIDKLRELNRDRRVALKEIIAAVEEIIKRDELEAHNLERQLKEEGA